MQKKRSRVAEAVDHPNSLIHAYLGVGFLSLRQRDLSRAIPVLERCLELCRVYNIQLWFPETASALGCAYAFAGRIAEALPLLEQVGQMGASTGTISGQSLWVSYVSQAYLLAGRMQEAVHSLGMPSPSPVTIRSGDTGVGPAAPRRDRDTSGPPEIEPAEITTSRPSPWPTNSVCARLWPTATSVWARCLQTGQREQARAELSTAIKMYHAMEMTFWLSQAEARLAEAIESR